MPKQPMTYEEILRHHPVLRGVVNEKSWDFMKASDRRTVYSLEYEWIRNLRWNVHKKMWKTCGPVQKDCTNLGKNKAIIGIGAGPSLKKNLDVLKRLHDEDGRKSWEDREFLLCASNHMYKPLLRDHIIPDFVVLTDASTVVRDQLLKDVPDSGKNTILLAGLHCAPRVLKAWRKQGREIRFYMTSNEGLANAFRNCVGVPATPFQILQGGNVLNLMWSLAAAVFKSKIFIALGNDLSFPLFDNLDKQRHNYYADHDYSSNAPKTGTGRDEAKTQKKWLGFCLKKKKIRTPTKDIYDIELNPVGTTHTLWVYKTWLESMVVANSVKTNVNFHYYNCTEGGISGVMCKNDSEEGLNDESNWYMLDEVCSRYHTRTLEDAIREIKAAREMLEWENEATHIVAPDAAKWGQSLWTDTAPIARKPIRSWNRT